MKYLTLFIFSILLLVSCSDNEPEMIPAIDSKIFASWDLTGSTQGVFFETSGLNYTFLESTLEIETLSIGDDSLFIFPYTFVNDTIYLQSNNDNHRMTIEYLDTDSLVIKDIHALGFNPNYSLLWHFNRQE